MAHTVTFLLITKVCDWKYDWRIENCFTILLYIISTSTSCFLAIPYIQTEFPNKAKKIDNICVTRFNKTLKFIIRYNYPYPFDFKQIVFKIIKIEKFFKPPKSMICVKTLFTFDTGHPYFEIRYYPIYSQISIHIINFQLLKEKSENYFYSCHFKMLKTEK